MKYVSCLLLQDDAGRVILQHRSTDQQRSPGKWGFFGGHNEVGESPEETLLREIEEELQIIPEKYTFFNVYDFLRGNEKIKKYIYTAPLTYSVEELRKKQTEGQDLGLFTYQEILALDLIDHDWEVIQDIFFKQ